jgi:glyoxylase-like metal-dependent hydrolase (beta-lactamase superfamily II)
MTQPLLPSGVHVIERGWLSANSVVATGQHNRTLIDSGYWTHSAQTLALVQTALGGHAPDLLLNTHLHSDHCGGNAALQSTYPAMRTLIPPGHAPLVTAWDTVGLSYVPTGQHCPRFNFQGLLTPGTEIYLGDHTWEIHAARGHDPHSVVLFQRESRTLVSADALWENGFGVVFPELEGEDAFDAVAATLGLIADLAPMTVIPGHGPVFNYSEAIMQRAHSRLAAFVSNPVRHANHAAKVLLKFKLLELQTVHIANMKEWAFATPYLALMHSRFFIKQPSDEWLTQLIAELVASGAARHDGNNIVNT